MLLQEACSFIPLCSSDLENEGKKITCTNMIWSLGLKVQLVEVSASQPVEVQVCWTFSTELIFISSSES